MKIGIHFISSIVLLFFLSSTANAVDVDLSIVDQHNQSLANAVAALVPEKKPEFPIQKAIIDQQNNLFVPDLLVVRTNTLINFPNSDDVRHHVYSFSAAKKFELRLYHGKTAEPVLFDNPGKIVLGCNIHDSMSAHIFVLDTDYYQISGADGKIRLQNIPDGNYKLQIFHPKMEKDFIEESVQLFNTNLSTKSSKTVTLTIEPPPPVQDEFEGLF
jgi:plastocyanin